MTTPYVTEAPINYPDGSCYMGEMLAGKRHGRGNYTLADGSVFEGQFVHGVVHGHGKIEEKKSP